MARQERIARPARSDEWEVVAADEGVADDWDRWAKQEPNARAAAYDQLATIPTQFSSRQKRLEGKTYGTGTYEGKTLARWQYEATAGGRIFYFVDVTDDWTPLDDLVALHTADDAGELHRRLVCFTNESGNKADAFEPWCLFHQVHTDEPDGAVATALLLLT
ncbi:MAG: hypothetical protein ACRDZN_14355, partial [Acidimicrobiales bacterium]